MPHGAWVNGILHEYDYGRKLVKVTEKVTHIIIFDSWFDSKTLDEAVMDIGSDINGMVKTNKEVLCKYIIKNNTKYFSGGSYFMLKRNSTMTGNRPLIGIVYNYNYRKVLYFIDIDDEVITKSGNN